MYQRNDSGCPQGGFPRDINFSWLYNRLQKVRSRLKGKSRGVLTCLVRIGEIRPSHSYKTILEQREERDQLNSRRENSGPALAHFEKQIKKKKN